jgi:hypothetical protein
MNKYLIIIIPIAISLFIPFYLIETDLKFRSEISELLIETGLKEPIERPYSLEDNTPIVYHALFTNVTTIIPNDTQLNSKKIPNKLIISSGFYQFDGNIYDLHEEGLYRFISPLKQNEQRIIFSGKNIDALISGVSWIYSHGNSDNDKGFEEINNKALNSKIFGTCGAISTWIYGVLESQNIKSRIVHTLTLNEWNTYDNGHTMIEVYHDDFKKWVLYDLDNNAYFSKNEIPLSLIEFIDAVKSDDYEVHLLASDTRLDVSNFNAKNNYDFSFFAEGIYANENTKKNWYKRVIQVPMIEEDKFSYFMTNNDEERKRVESYASYYKYLSLDEFLNKFYNNFD